MLRIHFVDNRQAPVWLADEQVTLGRDSRNDLVLDAPGIEAFHAKLYKENGFHYLTDLGSAAGSYINDEKIGERYQIRSGDRLRLGTLELQIVDPAKVGAKVRTAPRWLLEVLHGENQGHKYHVTGSMTFGRSVKCELCFSDPQLSRRHAEFYLKGDILEVKDLASANGLRVNNQKVASAVLQPGDKVQLGGITLLVIGPRVSVPEAIDEDATVFMRAAELPAPAATPAKPVPPRPASPNPLHVAPAAPAPAASTGSVRLKLMLACLALALLAGAAVRLWL